MIVHPKVRKEPVVEERALAVGTGVAGDGAYPEPQVAVKHLPERRKPELAEEGVAFMRIIRGDAGVPENQVRDLSRGATSGIDAGIGRAQVCLPPPGKECLHLL